MSIYINYYILLYFVCLDACRTIFFERVLRINNDKVLGLHVVVDIVVIAVAKVLIVVVWPLSNTSLIVILKMAALLKNVCGSH